VTEGQAWAEQSFNCPNKETNAFNSIMIHKDVTSACRVGAILLDMDMMYVVYWSG